MKLIKVGEMRFIHKLALVLKCYVCVVQQFNILC